jgi:hypothetical protein
MRCFIFIVWGQIKGNEARNVKVWSSNNFSEESWVTRFDAVSLGECYRLYQRTYFQNVSNLSPTTQRLVLDPSLRGERLATDRLNQ